MMLQKCRLCSHSIMWLSTATGKKMPVDPNPVEYGGNLVIRDNMVHVLKKGDPSDPDEPRYRAHFATCKVAEANRKKIAAEKKAAERKAAEPPSLFEE